MPVASIQEGGRFAAVGVSSCLIQEGGRFAAVVPNSLKETLLIIEKSRPLRGHSYFPVAQ